MSADIKTSTLAEVSSPGEGYDGLCHLFLELRARGMALSSLDLDVLSGWQAVGVPVDLITDVMLDVAEDCAARRRPYPSNLQSIDRRVRSVLRNQIQTSF